MRLHVRVAVLVPVLALSIASLGGEPAADAVGPGGWDHLGTQIAFGNVASSLNGDVLAMSTDIAGSLLVAGKFTDAAGIAGLDHVAVWNGAAWSGVGAAGAFNGDVHALAVSGGRIFAGGVFTNAGGDTNADFLAVYDGTWHGFCNNVAPLNGNVHALQVVGNSLYVGGTFQTAGNITTASYLVRCDLVTGAATSTIVNPLHSFTGPVYALTADAAGNLYAAGGFSDLEDNTAADNVAMLPSAGVWTNLGSGPGVCGCAVDDFARALTSDGTNVYVGTDSSNVAGIAQADHIARWNGSAWSALGSDAAGSNGYLSSPSTSIAALLASGGHLYATGNSWGNIGGDPTADFLGDFDGASWKPIGSDGAGNGSLTANGESFAVYQGVLHVGGNFTKAGGDSLASFIARYTGVPNNKVTVGKVKANKGNGTAKLTVGVPGGGVLVVAGKGVKGATVAPTAAGNVALKVKAKGKLLKQLKAKGHAKAKVTVTFTPTGGTAASVTQKVKLVLKH